MSTVKEILDVIAEYNKPGMVERGTVKVPGKFEGEPVCVVWYYEQAMNGFQDESDVYSSEPFDTFYVNDVEHEVFDPIVAGFDKVKKSQYHIVQTASYDAILNKGYKHTQELMGRL